MATVAVVGAALFMAITQGEDALQNNRRQFLGLGSSNPQPASSNPISIVIDIDRGTEQTTKKPPRYEVLYKEPLARVHRKAELTPPGKL